MAGLRAAWKFGMSAMLFVQGRLREELLQRGAAAGASDPSTVQVHPKSEAKSGYFHPNMNWTNMHRDS